MSPASPTPIVMQVTRQRIGTCEALGRNAARTVAKSQGHVFASLAGTGAVQEHASVQEIIDRRGDTLMAAHRAGLSRAAELAKRAGAYEVHSLLVDLIASAALLAERWAANFNRGMAASAIAACHCHHWASAA